MQEKQQQLKEEVKQLLEQAEAADEEEDAAFDHFRSDLSHELGREPVFFANRHGHRGLRAVLVIEGDQKAAAIVTSVVNWAAELIQH